MSLWNIYQIFRKISHMYARTHGHTHYYSSSFIVTLSLIRRTACAHAQFNACSSKTNAHSQTGRMAVCCQNLTLGVLSSSSAHSLHVGALFKKFGLFLNTPHISWGYKIWSHIHRTAVVLRCSGEKQSCPLHATKGCRGIGVITPLFLNVGAR